MNKILFDQRVAQEDVDFAKEYIIFPYYFLDGKLKKITYDDFLYKYPKVLKHLEYYKNKLEMRDKDKSSQWFEYGRSQALAHLKSKKIVNVYNSYKKYRDI